MIGTYVYCLKKYELIFGLIFISSVSVLATNVCNFKVRIKQTLMNEGFHSKSSIFGNNLLKKYVIDDLGQTILYISYTFDTESGWRRNITYGIVFNTENDDERWLYEDCVVGLEQELPSGVFTNPDELSDLRRSKKLNAFPKNRVNIELPAEQSSPNKVYITGKVIDGKVNLWLPVHARYYQAVSGGGTARNEIEPPTLFLHCSDERLEICGAKNAQAALLCNGSSREKCKWKEIPYTMMTDTLIWDVPVGNTDHYYLVATSTAIVIVVGSLYLLKAIHEYQVSHRKKKL